MDFQIICYPAVLVAALSAFATGALWYSPVLFGNVWMKEAAVDQVKARQANMFKIFGLTFFLSLIICFFLAALLGNDAGLIKGILSGAFIGGGWVTASLGILYLFEGKSLRLFLINAGYEIVTYMVAGGIIGVWQ